MKQRSSYWGATASDPDVSKRWTHLGAAGGGVIDGRTYGRKACYLQAIGCDLNNARAWAAFGALGGGDVLGRCYDAKSCYATAIECDPSDSMVWNDFGVAGGGEIDGRTYNARACYRRAIKCDGNNTMAWNNLGAVGGGEIEGRTFDAKACYLEAILCDATNSTAWCNFGGLGGGEVGSCICDAKACYVEAIRADLTNPFAWVGLGEAGGGEVGGDTYDAKACYLKAIECDSNNPMAWRGLAAMGGGIVAGQLYSDEECFEEGQACFQSLSRSNFRTIYQSTPTPDTVQKLLRALELLVDALKSADRGVTDDEARLIEHSVSKKVLFGNFKAAKEVAAWFWTLPAPHFTLAGQAVCAHLNEVVRSDDAEMLRAAMPLARAWTPMMVTSARGGPVAWPPRNRTLRGVGLPEHNLSFFRRVGKQYRVNFWLSSTSSEQVAWKSAMQSRSAGVLPTIFTIHLDPVLRCQHMNCLEAISEVPNEAEFTFPPFAAFTVKSAPTKGSDGCWHVEIETACEGQEVPEDVPSCSFH